MGLENRIEAGFRAASSRASDSDPGQVFWYETPSKSLSVAKQPPIAIRSDASALKHCVSSASFLFSVTPGLTQTPLTFAWLQYSKCPISSANATL